MPFSLLSPSQMKSSAPRVPQQLLLMEANGTSQSGKFAFAKSAILVQVCYIFRNTVHGQIYIARHLKYGNKSTL